MQQPTETGNEQSNEQLIHHIAHEKFGYEQLKPGQEEAIKALLGGEDTLVVMPTGGGKSAIYQIAGLLLEGPTVVVSPLIALQQDQVEAINSTEAGNLAAVANSTLNRSQRREVFTGLEEGNLEFLLLAPEQFSNEDTLERLRAAKPSLFVVDEAHCIAEWGHDFRPDYLKLGAVIEALGHPATLALTATASPLVREEIVARLGMRKPHLIVRGFDRPNIHLSLKRFEDAQAKRAVLLDHVVENIRQEEKPGIVYTATRKEAEEVAAALEEQGIRAVFYHAGRKASEREQVQQAFMQDEADVIVATVAFGMGVDKPNVRFVFHLDISDSLDSYYQEIGRAGRDGLPAKAILFYLQSDLGLRRFLSSNGQISEDEVKRVMAILAGRDDAHQAALTLSDLQEQTELSQAKLNATLRGLEEAKAIETLPNGVVLAKGDMAEADKLAQVVMERIVREAVESQKRRRHFETSRLEMMQSYAETRDCLRQYVLNYFGQEFKVPCNGCINCDAGFVKLEEKSEAKQPFPLNSRVSHRTYGQGQVMRYEADKMVVLFDDAGYKTLAVNLVLENNLLESSEEAAPMT